MNLLRYLIVGSALLLSCSDVPAPAQKVMALHYSIRKTFIESSGNFRDSLAPVFPNPFNHNTGDSAVTINFTLVDTGEAKIIIQNPLGDSVVIFQDSVLPGGSYTGFWHPVAA